MNIHTIISAKNWELLLAKYRPKNLCEELSFEQVMLLAYNLFYENMYDDRGIQEFALDLAFEIRKQFPTEWDTDWKHDVFLGNMCAICWKYEEQFHCFKRAYDKLVSPPDSLLLLLAGCKNAPGQPPLSDQEAEAFLLQAVQKKITYEAALMMKALYKDKGDQKLEEYWNGQCAELEKNRVHTEAIIPEIFQ